MSVCRRFPSLVSFVALLFSFLHQLLFGSAEASLHPVACDGTCCIHKPWVQGQCSGFPFRPLPLVNHHPPPFSVQLRENMSAVFPLWLFPECTCEVGGCVVMWVGFVCVCDVVVFHSSHRGVVQERWGHQGLSDFMSFSTNTWKKPQTHTCPACFSNLFSCV